MLLIDGVEDNDLASSTAWISRQFPLSNIDRIEVVYGPASTMYGANAFAGVINVITKEPEQVVGVFVAGSLRAARSLAERDRGLRRCSAGEGRSGRGVRSCHRVGSRSACLTRRSSSE